MQNCNVLTPTKVSRILFAIYKYLTATDAHYNIVRIAKIIISGKNTDCLFKWSIVESNKE